MKKRLIFVMSVLALLVLALVACNKEPHLHSWSEWTVTTEATCTTAGAKYRTCSCGDREDETISPKGHDRVTVEKVPATCTEDGLTEGKYCSVCGTVLVTQQVAPAKGHTEVIDKAVLPTCTESGFTEGKHCSDCGLVIVAREEVKETGHSEVIDEAVAPTCNETGLTEGKHCSVCNNVIVAQEKIPATGHTEVTDAAASPSCIVNGLTEGKHCSVCNVVIIAQKPISAVGHSYENKVCITCGRDLDHSLGLEFVSRGDGTCYVSGVGSCEDEEIIIPDRSPAGDAVTGIGKGAFAEQELLKSVMIPESVTVIGEDAFYRCPQLAVITFADGVRLENIGDRAFEGCVSLTVVNVPASVVSIGYKSFAECSSVKQISFADGNKLAQIGTHAFLGCVSLESVIIPAKVTEIKAQTFSGCISLKTVGFEEGSELTVIGDKAFYGCRSLFSAVLPEKLSSIGVSAFENCYRLVELINYSDMRILAGETVNGYVSSHAIEVHTGESKIKNSDDYLFYTYNDVNYLVGYIGNHISLILPESYNGGTYAINDYAFYYNDTVESIVIPAKVTVIGGRIFGACDALVSITVDEANADYRSEGNCIIENKTETVIAGCKESVIPEGVRIIGDSAFIDTQIVSVYIPGTVTVISRYAFYECSELESFTFDKKTAVNVIGEHAFRGCSSLKSIVIPAFVQSIGNSTFFGCRALESVEFGGGSCLVSIGSYAFYECLSLKSITFPSTLKTIGSYTMYYCRALETVAFEAPSSLTSIGEGAFSTCDSLTRIEFSNSTSKWNAVEKGSVWNNFTGEYMVYCSNGVVEKIIETEEEEIV